MITAHDLESNLKNKSKASNFVLKPNPEAKSDVWQNFLLIFKINNDTKEEAEQKYFCACKNCNKVYAYKATNGTSFGTKNLLEHIQKCKTTGKQLNLHQTMTLKRKLMPVDQQNIKELEVKFCAGGYHSFRSVEQDGFQQLLQACVDLGAKYGKLNVKDVLVGRMSVARETVVMAGFVKKQILSRLKEPIDDETVAVCVDLYTDDYRKRSYLDIHAVWIDRNFNFQHAIIAVRHFGTQSHTSDNISSAVSDVLAEYGLSSDSTPITTDHGANVVAALKNGVRLDCMCHRLHTVLENSWKATQSQESEVAQYEAAISELCRYVKQATGIQVRNLPFLLHIVVIYH